MTKGGVLPKTVFFSWQSDTSGAVSSNFIEGSLKQAIKDVSSDAEIIASLRSEESLQFDKDTLNIPGSPAIVSTIFEKITASTAFVADLTFVAKRLRGGLISIQTS